ncbi:MAG TPA: DUF4389 domain-containing protein [Candidatus Saccharimonadales bacterium]|nr:DUF4389 domain-containing protein [Candidatus Saccharimonadales bacterium]
MAKTKSYPVSLEIEHQEKLDRFTSFFRLLWVLPILVVLTLLLGPSDGGSMNEAGKEMGKNGGGIIVGLFAATALMILFRQRYPRWWFDFALELNRFSTRISAYIFLLTDKYPSTVENQSVRLEIEYPEVKQDLNRWLPLVKWLLALPHYIVLAVLMVGVLVVTIIAWFAILFTGKYPKGMFNFVVGFMRWNMRVYAYAFLLSTDQYPPFSFK